MSARRRELPAIRLYCLPYSGGGSSAYAQWHSAFPEAVEVCSIELPGRQTRWRDAPFSRLEPLIDALASALLAEVDVPYALFGHSMGALVAFELARALRQCGASEPRVLFVSGGPAPQIPRPPPWVHNQPEPILIDKLRSLGGVPEEVYSNPELLELLLPTIRADFAVCETYQYRPSALLACPIVAFAGSEDREVPIERVAAWREQTRGGFGERVLPGDHYFLRRSENELIDAVRATLTIVLQGCARQEPRAVHPPPYAKMAGPPANGYRPPDEDLQK